jgi:predicted AlkP superfamily phosphohydrolase/phosphomutase
MRTEQVLVIGLDGVTFDLLTPLISKGLMPCLSSLLEKSYHGVLLSTVPPISATAWTTLITGVNPGKHGVLQFVSLRPEHPVSDLGSAQEIFPGGVSLLNANSIRGTTLWELLTDAGKQQIVINVPMTYPPRPLSGCMVTGMMTPPDAAVFTYPPELSKGLRETRYETDLSIAEKEFDFDPTRLIERLSEVLAKRRDVALQLMQGEPWDFSMVVFTGTDRLQHRFWRYLVPGHPEYGSAEATQLRPQLEKYFQDLDQAIASLIGAAKPEASVIIMSDHGFGPASERTVHRLSMMKSLGIAQVGMRSGIARLRNIIEGHLGLTPDQVHRIAKMILPRKWLSKTEALAREAQLSAMAADRAYSVTLHEYVGGIYINQDQLPVGTDSYVVFRQEIISGLKELLDPDTGDALVARIHTREELYSGSALDECPDIVFFLAPGYGLSGGVGPGGALVSPRKSEANKQGTHRDEGILLIHGPCVNRKEDVREQLIDVTSTILLLLGMQIPTAMDSRPILAALDERFLEEHPPTYVDVSLRVEQADETRAETWTTDEDAEEILERLRALGYVE